MIVDPDFLDHWRTGMVADALGDPMAAMYILRLWAHCQARKSDTFAMPARGLKAQCRFPGDAEQFEAALIEAGFLERNGENLTAVGWADQNAALLAAWSNGSKGGRPRKNPPDDDGEPAENPLVNRNGTDGLPDENPDETDKSREDKKKRTTSAKPTVPCPYVDIVELYHQALPSLPKVRLMDDKRQRHLRDFWGWVLSSRKSDGTPRASSADEAMVWIRGYFERATENDFLMGRTQRKPEHEKWRPDIDFLVSEKGRKQVIERTQEAA